MKELVELQHDLIQVRLREVEAGSDLEILEERIAETRKRLKEKGSEVDKRKLVVCTLRFSTNLAQSKLPRLLHKQKPRASTISVIGLWKIFRRRRMNS